MMKYIALILAFLSFSASAQTEWIPQDYRLDFVANSFVDDNGDPTPPHAPVVGSITFNHFIKYEIAVTSVNMTIDGHSYTLPEMDGQTGGHEDGFYFGGGGSYGGMSSGTNDFSLWVGLDGSGWMQYVTPNHWIYESYEVKGTYTNVTAAVPEPETYSMLLAGVGLIGLLAARRRTVG
jgi:hypothetical protein